MNYVTFLVFLIPYLIFGLCAADTGKSAGFSKTWRFIFLIFWPIFLIKVIIEFLIFIIKDIFAD